MADYIDRASIIEAIEECQTMTNESKFVARILIYAEPSADVRENVHGEWIKDIDGIPVCSECGEVALQRMFIKPPKMMAQVDLVLSDYCPNCGADMRCNDGRTNTHREM